MSASNTSSARGSDKRAIILETALTFFAREGFHNADVQLIADEAKVGKGTVYRHFENKEGLFLAAARHCLDQLTQFIQRKIGTPTEAAEYVKKEGCVGLIRLIAVGCAEYYQQHPEAIEIMLHERAEFRGRTVPTHVLFRAESRHEFDAILHRAIGAGELRDIDVNHASNAYNDLVFGSIVNGHLEGKTTELVERITQAIDFFLTGLQSPRKIPRKK